MSDDCRIYLFALSYIKGRKGQLSIEFLLIFAIFLSILSLFFVNFLKMKDRVQKDINEILLSKYLDDIENSINSICILGEGNERILSLNFPEETNLSLNGRELILASTNINKSFVSKCNVDIDQGIITIKNGNIKIESKKGKIIISNS
ncbi:MAG: class III signal peptide-containing protein [Candidatus Micrarchaeia archaeon]